MTTQQSMSVEVAYTFITYIKSMLAEFKLLHADGTPISDPYVSVELTGDESKESIIKRAWDSQAAAWPSIESFGNYFSTMVTLLEHFRVLGEGKAETILSLGAGPGLYETFLAAFTLSNEYKINFVGLDFSYEMTKMHKELIKKSMIAEGDTMAPIYNINAITGDMTALPFADSSIDQVICNNTLQWVPDWQKAIQETARVMNPNGLGALYLFIHNHSMSFRMDNGTTLLEIDTPEEPEFFDFLEANDFELCNIRHMMAGNGAGQYGAGINKKFIFARYKPNELRTSWRNSKAEPILNKLSVTIE